LDKLHGAVEQTAEYLYQRGAALSQLLYDEEGNLLTDQAIKFYERAVVADKRHSGALFGLAMESERRGNDEDALDLYKQAISRFPTHSGALFNLGVLYEDLGRYDQAIVCFQRVSDAQPENQRARLFYKDAKASSEMHIDEDSQRRKDRMSQILSQPVTDFELSVRSRNCLKTMGILTLEDLCSHTEQDLLTSKNFGETSLLEIREMLSLKGLRLGLFAQERQKVETFDISTLSPETQALLECAVTDLNLSVRARKCMSRLNIQTVGELICKSADELLECKNFGVTSLNEIREKLLQPPFELRLRGE
jgi:DNA-directed RNA polymerase subunit alpha